MAMQGKTINFYRQGGAYGAFSNFSAHHVFLKDKSWPTSEHYFQAQKFAGTPHEEEVRRTSSPGKSAQMGRDRRLPLRKDWDTARDDVMYDVIKAKFTQNKELNELLLSTEGATLVEHTENDSYWGDGGDGSGKNQLGKTLMRVRDELLAAKNSGTPIETANSTQQTPIETINSTQQQTSTQTEEQSQSSGSGESGESDEEEGDIEPNVNKQTEMAFINASLLNAKRPPKTKKSRKHSKRAPFKDADGNSTMEKSNAIHGNVSLVGEGNVSFPEKALPPQAKFVVHKYQMQKKWQPKEEDFDDDEDEDVTNEYTRRPDQQTSYPLAYFVKDGQQPEDDPIPPELLAESLRLQQQPTTNTNINTTTNTNTLPLTISECIEATNTNVELLSTLPPDFPETQTIKETCKQLQATISKYIQEITDDTDMANLLEAFEKLDIVLK